MSKEVLEVGRHKSGEVRRQYTSTLREDLFLALQERSIRTGIPMSKILDRAIESYLAEQNHIND